MKISLLLRKTKLMKKLFCLSALFAIAISAHAQKHTVVGRINGLTNDTLFQQYAKITEMANPQAYVKDTIYARKGRFSFDIPNDDAYFVVLRPMQCCEKIESGLKWYSAASDIKLYIDKGERIKLKGSIDGMFVNYEAKGSQTNVDNSTLRAQMTPLLKQAVQISRQAEECKSQEEYMQVMENNIEVFKQIHQMNCDFMRMHPDRLFSGTLLASIPTDSVAFYNNLLTDEVKESMFKPMIASALKRAEVAKIKNEAMNRITVGKIAPDFTLQKSDGTSFTLSSLRGKYVLLDFWGSWCVWCIKGFPELKQFYADNKERLEVVGIACKDTHKDWLAAVEKHQLPWTNVYNPTDAAVTEDMINLYNISGFPTKILLDPEGRIAEICVGENPEFYDTISDKIR